MKKWLLIGLMLVAGVANAAIVQGKDYVVLAKPQPVADAKKVEVLEFFSYTCIHCYNLEPVLTPYLDKLPADVAFNRIQVVWGKPMEGFARLVATEAASGTTAKLHRPIFEAVMKQRIDLSKQDVLTDWLKKQPGVDAAKFMQVYQSFGVNAQVARQAKMTRDYAIEGTPTIVVAGKYATLPAEPQRLVEVLNELVGKARTEMKK